MSVVRLMDTLAVRCPVASHRRGEVRPKLEQQRVDKIGCVTPRTDLGSVAAGAAACDPRERELVARARNYRLTTA
jgi:hypothetical protein